MSGDGTNSEEIEKTSLCFGNPLSCDDNSDKAEDNPLFIEFQRRRDNFYSNDYDVNDDDDDCPDEVEDDAPLIKIQHDWEYSDLKKIWFSSKFRGCQSTHSKFQLKSLDKAVVDGYTLFRNSPTSIKLTHDFGFECTFYSSIGFFDVKKKIVAIDVGNDDWGVFAYSDNTLVVWSLETGEFSRKLIGHVGSVNRCKFFPSGTVILSGGSDMQMKIWCARSGICPVTLTGHKGAVNDFCIVDKGRNVISVSKDGTARLWNCGQSECLGVIFQSSDTLNCCAIGERENIVKDDRQDTLDEKEIGTKNKLLLIGSEEGFIYGIAVYIREVLFSINLNSPVNVILLRGTRFLGGCQNGKVEVYKYKNQLKKTKLYSQSNSPVLSGCLYRQHYIIGRSDGTVSLFPVSSKCKERVELTGADCDPIYSISTLNNLIFTACRDCKIRIYRIQPSI